LKIFKCFGCLLIIFGTHYKVYSQKFTNVSSFRNFSQDSYFRLNYDNDFFAHSDDNYTQGISLEFVNPIFKNNPINYLFYNSNGTKKYGLTIEHVSFTPDVISKKEIQYGYRPFAAAFYLKFFKTDENTSKNDRVYSSFSVGVIGPLAYGAEGQTYIHEKTDNWIPYGWRNQISNDVVINYEIKHEKNLLKHSNLIFINSDAGIRLGSLNTDISLGFTGIIGNYNLEKKKNLQVYGYTNPRIFIVGYDASLQGGLFSNSIYTFNASEITRVKYQIDYGIVLKNNFFYLEYTLSTLSKEFKTGSIEDWGGIRVGLKF
jgi:lipid A 3-O-deacylase